MSFIIVWILSIIGSLSVFPYIYFLHLVPTTHPLPITILRNVIIMAITSWPDVFDKQEVLP